MVYKTSIITFIDYLGFKELLSNLPCNEVNQILSIFDAQCGMSLRHTSKSAELGTYYKYQFSDSLVRITCPKDNEKIEELLLHEISYMTHNQLHAICYHNIFIRGGITIGDIFYDHNNGRVFGPGFIKAYELESKVAKQPVVVIDTDISGIVKAPRITDNNCDAPYINYLCPENFNEHWAEHYFNDHKQKIINNFKQCYDRPKEKAKCEWLINYHNHIIIEYKDWIDKCLSIKSNDLLINI
jgi:hypothetical protein